MEPRIARSLKAGFQAANYSWPGIGLFAAAGLLVAIVAMVGFMLTRPPRALLPEAALGPDRGADAGSLSRAASAPVAVSDSDLLKTAAAPHDAAIAATDKTAPADSATPADSAAPAEAPAPAAGAAPAAPVADTAAPVAPAPSGDAGRAAEEQAIQAWFSRAWPMLLLLVLVLAAASVWLSGGQIGYVVKQVMAGPASIAEFWKAANQAFIRLLGGSAIALAGILAATFAAAVLGAAPPVLATVVAVVLIAAAVWLVVRLSFWFIIIVTERLGPIAALGSSFRATQGRWWKIFAVGLVTGLISYSVVLVDRLIAWTANRLGGPLGMTLSLIGSLLGMVASLYVTFAALAALVRFYEDVKTSARAPAQT